MRFVDNRGVDFHYMSPTHKKTIREFFADEATISPLLSPSYPLLYSFYSQPLLL